MAVKDRTLYILKYLWENTDEDHPVTTSDILLYLKEVGIPCDRKTIPGDIEALNDAGFCIECKKSRQNLYCVSSRVFELAELKLLVDAVESSKFISANKSKELVGNLCQMCSKRQASELNRHLYVEGRVKSDNKILFSTIDVIHKAINDRQRIAFRYYEYTLQKKKEFKHDGYVYELSPYALLWCNDNYYVLGFSEKHRKITKFRVDRMEWPKTLEKSIVRKPAGFDPVTYLTNIFSMCDGEMKDVRLKCDRSLMKTVIDRFGKSVSTTSCEDGTFIASVKISVSQTFFGWVFGFAGKMKIVAPADVREDYLKMLQSAAESQQK